MRIEILTVDGCPNAATTQTLVQTALRLEGARARIDDIVVETLEAAQRLHFVGSPSVRIDGEDIGPSDARAEYGLTCRIYRANGESSGSPPIETIRAAIRRAREGERHDLLTDWRIDALVYGLPAAAMIGIGFTNISDASRGAVWAAALTVMGAACAVNAARCGRVHCYFTGPFFLAAAIVALLYGIGALRLGAMDWNAIALVVLVGAVILYWLPERLLGRYSRPTS